MWNKCSNSFGNIFLFFFPSVSLSGFTGVAPAKKSPKLVSSCFNLNFYIHPPQSSNHMCASFWGMFQYHHLSLSHLISNSSLCAATCAHVVGRFVDMGYCTARGRIPVASHQPPPPFWRGMGRGALMHRVCWVANTLMIASHWVLSLQCEHWCMITAERLLHPVMSLLKERPL